MGTALLRVLSHFYAAILMYLKDNLQIKGLFWNSESGIFVAEIKQKQDATKCNMIRDSRAVEAWWVHGIT